MKTVQSGAHYTTVTVDTAEAVKFSFPSTSLSVEATGGDITVALTDTAVAGDDGTLTIPDGESRMFIHHRMNVDTYYLTGSGTATLYASNMGDVNPFKGKVRGGDGGGDNTHYKGTTTTPLENGSTTNPIMIDGENYTAVFGDVVVYGYTEFVFDGAQWSEFGRPFDTTPTSGSTNAVTSDGIYTVTPSSRGSGSFSLVAGDDARATAARSFAMGHHLLSKGAASGALNYATEASGNYSLAVNNQTVASGSQAFAANFHTIANQPSMTALGIYNSPNAGDLFNIGNGGSNSRSNIMEVNSTSANVNGDIKINNVAIPTPYTTMPTITADMLGKIAMYVGTTGGGYVQGCFYIAATDGAVEPTYSWARIGSGYKETTLYLNEGQTTPETITLTESFRNYDALEFVAKYYNTTGTVFINEHPLIVTTSSLITGESLSIVQTSASSYCTYWITDNTHFAKHDVQGFYLYSIKGIKY